MGTACCKILAPEESIQHDRCRGTYRQVVVVTTPADRLQHVIALVENLFAKPPPRAQKEEIGLIRIRLEQRRELGKAEAVLSAGGSGDHGHGTPAGALFQVRERTGEGAFDLYGLQR